MSANFPLFDKVFESNESVRPVRRELISVSPARRTDPETSHEAADLNKEERDIIRERVYQYLKQMGDYGATDYELEKALKVYRTSAGKRRGELRDAGLVVATDQRRRTTGKATAIVWKVK